jgi:hypothetical protein
MLVKGMLGLFQYPLNTLFCFMSTTLYLMNDTINYFNQQTYLGARKEYIIYY